MAGTERGLRRSVKEATPLRVALRHSRGPFICAALLSLLTNLFVLTLPLYMLQVYDRVLGTGHAETLLMLTLIAGVALGVYGALDGVRSVLLCRIGHWVEEHVAPPIFDNVVGARMRGRGGGAALLGELAKLRGFISAQGIGTFFDAPWVPVFLGLLFVLHPWLGALGGGAAIVMFALAIITEAGTRAPLTAASSAHISARAYADSALRNAEVMLAMGMRQALSARWQAFQTGATEASQAAGERIGTLTALTKFVRLAAQVGVLGLGALLVLRQELTPGAMIAGSIILARALAPMEQAMGAWRGFTNARLANERINDWLESAPVEVARTRLPAPVGELAVENVSFQPNGGSPLVLIDVSFTLAPGEALAVIGPSAAGKSSLCRLLIGIHQPKTGKVRLDGADLDKWDANALGRHIGYLPQDVELFAGTVRDNIARMRADASDEAVVEAARQAHAHDMILRLPEGYETQIGDGGARLAGGQRQRIGLARALFGEPKLIVLDEPNAHLDQSGESALAAAIGELKRRGATVVIVGHRPSTLHEVDKVMVLEDGRVAALGPREPILTRLRQPEPDAAAAKPAAAAADRP